MYRTDLACEAYNLHKNNLPDGIRQTEKTFGQTRIVTVTIDTDAAGKPLGKPAGRYVTIEAAPFSSAAAPSSAPETIDAISHTLSALLPNKNPSTLVVGLGNREITPDALGPLCAERILATRHIPENTKRSLGLDALGSVAVLAPGVLAQTGIESAEIITAACARVRPSAVIVIDALAAMSAARLGSTVQLADSGISPGSGVANSRRRIDSDLLGVPVISIGVPTVVDAATLSDELTRSQNADPAYRTMMITPREIDVIIRRAADTLALAVSRALHPALSPEDLKALRE